MWINIKKSTSLRENYVSHTISTYAQYNRDSSFLFFEKFKNKK